MSSEEIDESELKRVAAGGFEDPFLRSNARRAGL